VLRPLLILILAALFILLVLLLTLITGIVARIVGTPLILVFPWLGVLLFVSLSLIGFGSRHCANCPSQSRRFFQVWLPCKLPCLADHPV